MITGSLKSQIDSVWDDFWSGGISTPLEVMEQLTYLLFIRALDEEQTRAENKEARTGQPIDNPVFPEGTDPKGQSYENLRWSRFKNLAPAEMYKVVDEHRVVLQHVRIPILRLVREAEPGEVEHGDEVILFKERDHLPEVKARRGIAVE